jgi:hypothetical protein
MILASVKAGHYLIIENDLVIAEVIRKYGWSRGFYTAIGYEWKWRSTGVVEIFRTLPEIHEVYNMENYPGYGKILNNKRVVSGAIS